MNAPQISLHLRTFSPEAPGSWQFLLDQARAADVAGIDRIVVSDHVAMGEALDAYGNPAVGGAAGGKQPTGPDGHWLEPLTTLSVIAGQTTRVRLGTSVLLAALRRPVVLAKTAATLDVLSGGRLDIGVGVGWQREEYEAAGLDFDRRGAALEQSLEVCHRLWTHPVAEFDDGSLRFERIHQMPKPAQPGGVPIWVSGTVNPPMLRRLARYGSGWIPWGSDAGDLVNAIPRVRAALEAAGRDPHTVGVVGNIPVPRDPSGGLDLAAAMAPVEQLASAGVTDFRAGLAVPPEFDAAVEVLAPLVEAFRAATR